jgi:hypothetical protein
MAINAEYQAYLNSPKWKAKRREVLERAKYKCQVCKKRQAWQVHHKTYERIFNEPLQDLLSVCAKCHEEIHYYYVSACNGDVALAFFLKFPSLINQVTKQVAPKFSNPNSNTLFESWIKFLSYYGSDVSPLFLEVLFLPSFLKENPDISKYVLHIVEIMHFFPNSFKNYNDAIKYITVWLSAPEDKVKVRIKRKQWR